MLPYSYKQYLVLLTTVPRKREKQDAGVLQATCYAQECKYVMSKRCLHDSCGVGFIQATLAAHGRLAALGVEKTDASCERIM